MPHASYDAEFPNPHGIPNTDTVCIYAGGDTPHVWTTAEIAEQPERYRVPIWVRDNPQGAANADADCWNLALWLNAHAVPKGISIMLDLEGAVDPAYVAEFGKVMNANGYFVLPYGEGHSLFSNPEVNGYWLSYPAPGPTIDPRCVAQQWGFDGAYDLSLILDSVALWDTQPTPTPTPFTGPDRLLRGSKLSEGQNLASPNGRYGLVMQTDGNLVIYDGHKPLKAWGTTNAYGPLFLELQAADGNLVQYLWNGHPVWSPNKTPGAYLVMQNDGNLVLYTANNFALWSSMT